MNKKACKLKCSRCKETKIVSEFSTNPCVTRGYSYWCKDCHRQHKDDPTRKKKAKALRKEWYEKNKEKEKLKSKEARIKQYGITVGEYEQMLEDQNGVCKVCKTNNYSKGLHIDHDHTTGKVRALLCHGCNTALGLVNEDINRLKKLISYIEEN